MPWPHITHKELQTILGVGPVRLVLVFFFPFFFGADVLAEAGKRRVQCGEQSSRAARPRAVNYGFNFSLYGLLLTADQ